MHINKLLEKFEYYQLKKRMNGIEKSTKSRNAKEIFEIEKK